MNMRLNSDNNPILNINISHFLVMSVHHSPSFYQNLRCGSSTRRRAESDPGIAELSKTRTKINQSSLGTDQSASFSRQFLVNQMEIQYRSGLRITWALESETEGRAKKKETKKRRRIESERLEIRVWELEAMDVMI